MDLSNNQLSASLSRLPHAKLRTLNLSKNPLNETIPSTFFSQKTRLESINLSETQLKGLLPQLTPNIKELVLSNNTLQGTIPNSLAQVSRLEVLKLDNNLLIEPLPSNLRETKFANLRSFDISKNYIKDIAQSSQLSQTYLGLMANNPIIKNNRENNSEQFRIVLVDRAGNNKKEQLNAGEQVTVQAKKQRYKNGKFENLSLSKSEIELESDGVNIVTENFPSYVLKLTPGRSDGSVRLKMRAASAAAGEWIHAKFLLSQGEILDPELTTP